MPTVNLGRIKPIYRGAYSAATAYQPLDFVSYNGLTYFCTAASTGNLPTNTAFFQAVVDNNYTHPANHPPSIIIQDASNRFVTDTEKATWNAKGDVTLAGTQTLTNKTLLKPVITGFTETVNVLSSTTPALIVDNGTIQTWTLTANSTPTDGLTSGQSVILGITAGSFSVTWPSVTWSKVGGSGTAPTLTSTGVNWVILWKVSSTLRGAFLGTA